MDITRKIFQKNLKLEATNMTSAKIMKIYF